MTTRKFAANQVTNVFLTKRRKLVASSPSPSPPSVEVVTQHKLTPNSCDPKCLDDVLGQDPQKQSLSLWLRNGGRTVCMLSGPTGCGKTSLARFAIQHTGRQVMDARVCEDEMETFLRDVMRTPCNNAKFGILIDDVDTLSAPVRAKLLATLTKTNPTVPVICTCTDVSDKSVAAFAKACGTSIKLVKPRCASVFIRKHGPSLSTSEVSSIERACNGDLRQAAILVVQAMTWKRHQSVVIPERMRRLEAMNAKLPPKHVQECGELHNRSDATDRRVHDMFSATEIAFTTRLLDNVLTCVTYDSMVPVMMQEHVVKRMRKRDGDIEDLAARLERMSSGDILDAHPSHTTHEYASHEYSFGCMGMGASVSAPQVSFPKCITAMSRRKGNGATLAEVHALYSRRFVSHEDEDMVNTVVQSRMGAGEVLDLPKQTITKFKKIRY